MVNAATGELSVGKICTENLTKPWSLRSANDTKGPAGSVPARRWHCATDLVCSEGLLAGGWSWASVISYSGSIGGRVQTSKAHEVRC